MAVFVKVADTGSFSAAARILHLSSQMVAKHVLFLEDRLGARLLNRTTRRQSLTAVGHIYYERCRLVLAEAEAADSLATAEARTEPRGVLRISAPVTFGSHSLIPLVTRYLRDHPDVTVDLSLTDRPVDLIEEGFEAAFRIGPLANSSLVARALAPYRLLACAAPSYLSGRGVPEAPADLREHDCLSYAYWTKPMEAEWRFTRDGRTEEVEVRGRLQVNDSKGLLSAALDGFGIVLGAESVVAEYLSTGRLIRVLPAYEGPSRPMHLLFAPDRRQTPKLRRFIDAAAAAFAPRR